ncbi:SDR family NAD(P)-dependent oxidoreductase [Collimonas sp. OK412]|uniref:SDR family NAD(P)-dependent oxidoreductase n=1 Tax=Collimonas sp. (strain OK412) TaxID=1801619 RepID=UPI0015871427|nr:SDR family oxidoreductase [Collimonas sp. OK412]
MTQSSCWPYDLMPLSHYFSLKGKVAVVTGAAHDIAAHTARLLAAAGAQVAVLDVLEQDGQTLAQSMDRSGTRIRFWPLDVSDEVAVQRVFCEVEAYFGRIDILVNCAGVDCIDLSAQAPTRNKWETLIEVDSYGALLCTVQVIGAMERAGGGAIVNLSSMSCVCNMNEAAGFNASIIRKMTKADAVHYGARNIRVNSVQPGFIRAPALTTTVSQSNSPELLLNDLASYNPMRRIGATGDVAAGILYLVSDASRFITGIELVIDGDYICRNVE